MRRRLPALAAVVAVGGCATGLSIGAMPADVGPIVNRQSTASRGDVILPAEIQAASSETAYDAVLRLRPRFFTSDRSASSGRPRPVRQSFSSVGSSSRSRFFASFQRTWSRKSTSSRPTRPGSNTDPHTRRGSLSSACALRLKGRHAVIVGENLRRDRSPRRRSRGSSSRTGSDGSRR